MSRTESEHSQRAPVDEALIRRIEALTQAPEPDAARRIAFHAELDRCLARRRWRPLARAPIGAAGALAIGAAALLVWQLGAGDAITRGDGLRTPDPSTRVAAADPEPSSVEALLSLIEGEEDGDPYDSGLPADYVAIDGLLLGGDPTPESDT